MLIARRLFQQFMVDAYAKVKCERLQFPLREQKQLREESYKGLRDAKVNNDGNAQNVGQKVILPSTYCGDPVTCLSAKKIPWHMSENMVAQVFL